MSAAHVPVLPDEVQRFLMPQPEQIIADLTVGSGGHGIQIWKAMQGRGTLIALDRDPEMIEVAKRRFAERGVAEGFVKWVVGSFGDLTEHLAKLGIAGCDGILMDLGMNSLQMSESVRGFSFDDEGPLDMRYSRREPVRTLAELLEGMTERELEKILRDSDERFARRIARRVIERRDREMIRTTRELASAIRSALPRARTWTRIDPATRSFQAFRILVNDELGHLGRGLEQTIAALKPRGRMVVISFHSGEDRLVKQTFRKYDVRGREGAPALEILTRKPVRPSDSECERNPRARSARLRAALRVV